MASGTVEIGQVVWTSFKPILKMIGVAGAGALFARMGILTPEVSKSNSALIMKLFLPCLIFSTVIPSFGSDNMGQVAMILLTGLLYQAVGFVFGVLVKAFTPVPKSWKGGVWAAGLMSNWGDLVIAYTSTMAYSPGFNGDKDRDLGTAYSAVFMVSQLLILFNFNGIYLVQMDFKEKVEDEERQRKAKMDMFLNKVVPKQLQGVLRRRKSVRAGNNSHALQDLQLPDSAMATQASLTSAKQPCVPSILTPTSPTPLLGSSPLSPRPKTADSGSDIITPRCRSPVESTVFVDSQNEVETNMQQSKPTPIRKFWNAIKPFVSPPSVSLALSLIIANVPVLKALFVNTDEFDMPAGPDGDPPLDFIMDITSFAEPVVPVLGLILLGAAMSRLQIKSLPKGYWISVATMSALKLVVSPIIGIAWTKYLAANTPFITAENKMLQLVMVISAGVPTATTIIYMTTMYSPTHGDQVELSALSAMMLGQYAVMLISLTVTVSYTLMEVL